MREVLLSFYSQGKKTKKLARGHTASNKRNVTKPTYSGFPEPVT